MPSSTINELLQAIHIVRRRRILILHLRKIGWSLAILLALLIICGLLAMVLPPVPVFSIAIFCFFAASLAVLVWWYGRAARRFDVEDRRLAHYIDERTPGLQQRLLTSLDAWDKDAWDKDASEKNALDKQDVQAHSQLVASLWRDTLDHVTGQNIQRTANFRSTWFAAGTVLVLVLLLAGALWHWDRFAGATRRVVWPWSTASGDFARAEDFVISPGDILIRRGSDVTIAATTKSQRPKSLLLHIREGAAEWQQLPMEHSDSSKGFVHYLTGITGDMDYYVDSGYRRSRQFRIQVFDLTRMESIDVEYRYPTHTGMETKTEKNNGDVMAPEGTQVRLQVTFNRPIQRALLRFDSGPSVDLAISENFAAGAFTVTEDDTYVVDALDDAGRPLDNPIRYLVRAIPDAPPEISVTMPGRDKQVMALEEVSIAATATDDFGLTRLVLKYNVGGTAEHIVDLLNTTGQTAIETHTNAKALIYLEDLNVTPGDIIAYFVSAADNNGIKGPAETMSDIYFLEVINTDEAFRRASGMGGSGASGMGQAGQGRPPSALVENQKSIIAATWKLLMRQRGIPGETFDEDTGVVAESQQKLAQRTQMSLSRLTERFSFSDESYDRSVLHLREAVGHMQTAAEKLTIQDLEEALGPEQAALQAIIKAESQSRVTDIQITRNSGGAGGSGESQQERENLRELFDMEMGRLENRYELPRTQAGAGNADQDEVLKRLRELAQRQERLNRAQMDAQRREDRMTEAQKRRRLEELRREQEALRREAQTLSQRWSRQAERNHPRSALNALDQAVDRMQETARNLEQGNPGNAAASGRQALQKLHDQEKRMQRRNATVNELVKALAEKAEQLQNQETDIVKQMESAGTAAGRQTATADPQRALPAQDKLSEIVAKKDDLKQTLKDTEELVRATDAKSNTARPEIARQARDVLRAMTSESLQEQIEESKADLQPGRMKVAMEKEKGIEQSIARLGTRLEAFDALVPKSGEERLQEAADAADALARELENMRRTVEALRMQQGRPAGTRRRGEAQPGDGGTDQGRTANPIREGLERSRRYSQGLLQPWAQGEAWAVDARSIHRQLTDAQIEDFMNQPALWQKLMEPVRELASALREQLEIKQPDDNAFSPSEQAPPPQYESLIESYYRSLSEKEENNR